MERSYLSHYKPELDPMYIRILLVFVILFSLKLNAQHTEEISNQSTNRIIKIETIEVHIIKYFQDQDPDGEKRRFHTIEVFDTTGQVVERRKLHKNVSQIDSFGYEYDNKGREIKSTKKSGYTTKEYSNNHLLIERIFKGHRRHLIEKKMYSYPNDSTILIERWSNENKIVGKERHIVKNDQLMKFYEYNEDDSLEMHSIFERDKYGNVIKEEIFYDGYEYPVLYTYDIEYDKFGNYIFKKRKMQHKEDGWTERRTIQYENTVVPIFSTSDFTGVWVSKNNKDSIFINSERIRFSNYWIGRFKEGPWTYDQVEEMIKIPFDEKNNRYNKYYQYYLLLNEDELQISPYRFHRKQYSVYHRISK